MIPAIAIGRALVAGGRPASSICFVGSRRGMEGRIVPAAGFDVVLLPGRGIARRLTWQNVGAVVGLMAAFARAVVLVGRNRPAVVIAVGGYASIACALAAVLWRVPLVVAEQNAAPGLANRLAGRFASACAVSFPGTPLPRAVVTGNPVRPEVLAVDRSDAGRAAARRKLGLPDSGLVLAITGGSLGAKRINEAAIGMVADWADRPGLAVRHVIGERDFAEFSARLPRLPPGGLVYEQVEFENRMDLLLGARRRGGAASRSQHRRRAHGGGPAVHPGPAARSPGGPPDRQCPAAGRSRGGRGDRRLRPGFQATGLELDRLLGAPDLRARMSEAARSLGRTPSGRRRSGPGRGTRPCLNQSGRGRVGTIGRT